MVLSNAERQRRFRQRRNAAAKGAHLGKMAREAMDAATVVIWRLMEKDAGEDMGCLYGFSTLEEFRVSLVDPDLIRSNGSPGQQVREYIREYREYVEGDDAEVFDRAAALIDAVELTHIPAPEKPKRSRRK